VLWSARQSAPTVIQQVIRGCQAETNRKRVQFSIIFQVLCNGCPMVDYCETQHLLRHLNVKNLPKKHWYETSRWEMSEHIEGVVLHALKTLLKGSSILSLFDEVTAIDMTCWISVHVHIMEGWERVPHLLHISYVSEPGIADHLTERIMLALMGEGNPTREEIACKLVCFGVDGVSTFQGHKTGVTTQIREKYAPFSNGIHCFNHKMNLVVQTMSNYPMISRIESLL
jgi:hypothetical protein